MAIETKVLTIKLYMNRPFDRRIYEWVEGVKPGFRSQSAKIMLNAGIESGAELPDMEQEDNFRDDVFGALRELYESYDNLADVVESLRENLNTKQVGNDEYRQVFSMVSQMQRKIDEFTSQLSTGVPPRKNAEAIDRVEDTVIAERKKNMKRTQW